MLRDPQVTIEGPCDLAINIATVVAGAAVHIIRYVDREDEDRVPVLDELRLAVRLPEAFDRATCLDPAGRMTVSLSREGDRHLLTLRDVPLYGIVLLSQHPDAGRSA